MTNDPQYRKSEDESHADVQNISANLHKMNRGPISRVWADITAMWSMILDPTAAWGSKAIAIGALLYLVSPLDLIPDLIPVAGLTDDVAVIASAVGSLSYQLFKYRQGK